MRNNLAQNKNIINTFETVKMKNYYIISLENFLSRSRNFTDNKYYRVKIKSQDLFLLFSFI